MSEIDKMNTWGYLTSITGKKIGMSTEIVLVGSSPSCDITIDNCHMKHFISTEHFLIAKYSDYVFTIKDAYTPIGTMLNGEKIGKETLLKHGDSIIISTCSKLKGKEWLEAIENRTIDNSSTVVYRFFIADEQWIGHNRESRTSDLQLECIQKKRRLCSQALEKSSSTEGESTEPPPKKHISMLRGFKLLKSITCSLCGNILYEPMMTECGHNFCRDCLHGHLSCENDNLSGIYYHNVHKCPHCKKCINKKTIRNRPISDIVSFYIQNIADASTAEFYNIRADAIMKKNNNQKERIRTQPLGSTMKKEPILVIPHSDVCENNPEENALKKIQLDFTRQWSTKERLILMDTVNGYFGDARRMFFDRIGLTREYVQSCSDLAILKICKNLQISTRYIPTIVDSTKIRMKKNIYDMKESIYRFIEADDNLIN